MIHCLIRLSVLLVTGAATLQGVEPALRNSSTPTESKGLVTLVLVDAFSNPKVIAFVMRTAGDTGRDIILLRKSNLSPELVGAAVQALAGSRRRHGLRISNPVEIELLA
ncbi:MAG: hypothetical protein ACRD5Z_26530, partial [Bryobacteraceae bacterium]